MKLFIIIFFLLTSVLSAQIQIIDFNGKILDEETKEPVVFAHISFDSYVGVGVSTSENGDFKLIVDETYLDSKVLISCLGYEDAYINARDIQDNIFYLKPKTEFLQEVVIDKSDSKEVSIGSLKGKKTSHLSKRNITMMAQFINNNTDKSCEYLKDVTITFKKNWYGLAKARVRIFDKDKITGLPKNDLLTKAVIIMVEKKQKKYYLDLYDFDIEVPDDGFFVVIEKLIIPANMTFIAPIERSTYPKYVVDYKKGKGFRENQEVEKYNMLLSFEKYRSEVSHYAPSIDITEKKAEHIDFGNLYLLNSNTWELIENDNYIMPIKVTLSN